MTHPIPYATRVHVQQFGHGYVRKYDATDGRYDVLLDDGSTMTEIPQQIVEAR